MKRKKVFKILLITLTVAVSVILSLALLGTVAHATGLVDDTINVGNEYSKYALDNYQLDFFVDNSWGWLPWNWGDGLGKSVMYGLYAITNFIWTISLYLSSATGYLVQEAYRLDFISQTADAIGKNIQTIAGVTKAGFSTSGFYVGFLLILIFIMGIYVTYTGLLKRETTKAVRAVLNFVVVFVLSASFIAYAPDYITKINDFSKDISNASLDVGTKIVMPNSNTKGQDSVDMIRDSLFSIQVKQPWLLLQFGTTDVEALGEDRVEELLSASPDSNNGEDREEIVIKEIEDHENTNLTLPKTITRLGTVFFLFFFNIGISVFVFLLTGIMIFSQVLFIIFAMFLPISFLLSMIPTFEGMGKRAITKLFNVIMTRAGITLIITTAFSISTMLYSLSASSPFFMIMFLQIVTFAGIYFKLGDLMSMFSLQSSDSQSVGKQIMRKPRTFINRHTRGFQRKLEKTFSRNKKRDSRGTSNPASSKKTQAIHERPNENNTSRKSTNQAPPKQPNHSNQPSQFKREKPSVGKRFGEKTGTIMDTKNRVTDKAAQVKEQVKDMPTQAKYAVHKGKRKLVGSVEDFTHAVSETRENNQQERLEKRKQRRASIAQMRVEMDKRKREKEHVEPKTATKKEKRSNGERNRTASPRKPHERPHVKKDTPAKNTETSKQKRPKQQRQQNNFQHERQNIAVEKKPSRQHKTSSKRNNPSRKRQHMKSKKATKKKQTTTPKGRKK